MLEVREASFAYPGGGRALSDVSLRIAPGERVVAMGLNGSGKSTLARLLNGGILPTSGSVEVDGVEASRTGARELARLVGFVRQDPRSQIVSSLVSDEVAFGPRNLGLVREEVRARASEALAYCGLEPLADRLTTELSGGQQQLLALAGVIAMRPRYLVLDEACAQLDAGLRRQVREIVRRMRADGVGVLEIAHDVEALYGATRALVLEGGRIVWEGAPSALVADERALAAAGLSGDYGARALGRAVRTGYELGDVPDPEGLGRHLASLGPAGAAGDDGAGAARDLPAGRGHALALEGVSVSYRAAEALSEVSLTASSGLTLVLGRSGSGKTTMARVLAGILYPTAGEALLDGGRVRAGAVGLAFQRPEDQLFANTVLEDVSFAPLAQGHAPGEARELALEAARELGVGEDLLGRSPFELSGGQVRRVALAGVVAARPAALVLDEPTAGLDGPSRDHLRGLVRRMASRGAAVVVMTHDPGEWLGDADRVAFLDGGRLACVADARDVAADVAPFGRAGLEAPFDVRLRASWGDGAHA